MPKITQPLILNAEKKHSIRYDPPRGEEEPLSTGFYLQKISLLKGKVPSNIRVTVEWDE